MVAVRLQIEKMNCAERAGYAKSAAEGARTLRSINFRGGAIANWTEFRNDVV